MPSSFHCSLIRVTSGTVRPRFWKISVDNFCSIYFEGVDVIKSTPGELLWADARRNWCAPGCVQPVTGRGCSLCASSTPTLPLFFHT